MTQNFVTDKIGLACFLLLKNTKLISVKAKNRSRALFEFDLPAEQGVAEELAYTTSEHSRFFEAFKYLRGRALRGG